MEIRKKTGSSAVHLLKVREKENEVTGENCGGSAEHQPPLYT